MSAPELTVVTVPGCAGVGAAPAPEAEGCVAPSAWAYTSSTPRHEDIQRPPSGTESWRSATIARTSSPLGLARGMFWTLVATNVAIEMPPAVTYPTRLYVFPTFVKALFTRLYVTEA